MSIAFVPTHAPAGNAAPALTPGEVLRRALLACGVAGAAIYPVADILAAARYPGFSYRDQAVSELFAIGAPTADFLVPRFSASSTGILLLAVGIWMSARGRRLLQAMALLMALNAIDALVLWNFFPMHMRGEAPTFTDLMHGLLAIDPFLMAAIILGAVAYPGLFRTYTVTHLVVTTALALTAVKFVPAVMAGGATPWMGAAERAGQYATDVWYAVFAVMLMRRGRAHRWEAGRDR